MSKSGSRAGRSTPSSGRSSRSTPMTGKASSRVQSSAARNPSGRSARTGFAPRAQSAAARNPGPAKPQ